ncbi:MAG: N-6 DNA methylase [Haliangiales bacterium]
MSDAPAPTLEAARLRQQAALDAERSADERNRWGQFATPPALARAMARAALAYQPPPPLRFIEPALGSGSLFSALLGELDEPDQPGEPNERNAQAGQQLAAALGVELDPRFAEAARRLWGPRALAVRCADFTNEPPPPPNQRFNLLLANPPYVRHHHLQRDDKRRLQRLATELTGAPVSGLTGLYVYFMLLADRWLASGGVAAWLVPAEWMDVNYGGALRRYLTSQVQLLRVHRFEPSDVQFGDALVSSSIVFLRKALPTPDQGVTFSSSGLEKPTSQRSVSIAALRSMAKWGPLFRGAQPPDDAHSARTNVRLDALLRVRRGIATGANRFFIRPRHELVQLGVPDAFLTPILPSPRGLTEPVIAAQADGYPAGVQPLALLDCDLPYDELTAKHPRLAAYLDSAQGRAARRGYLASRRRPWYAQEQRAPAPIVATYMGRGRRGAEPFRFFWNQSQAIATNVYLMLFPTERLAGALAEDRARAGLVRDFLASKTTAELARHGRVYGGGLHKLEPRELGGVDATELADALGLR